MNKKLHFILTIGLQAQSLREILNKKQVISIQDKDKRVQKNIHFLTMELVITTPKGEVPARLIIMENYGYKLYLISKTNKSAEILNQTGYYRLGETGKMEKESSLHTQEYIAKKIFLKTNEMEEYLRIDFQQNGIEIMGTMDANNMPSHSFKIRYENPMISSDLFFDMENLNLIKKTINFQAEDGTPISEEYTYSYKNTAKELLSYPSEFSTCFGLAKVKSVSENTEINPNEFDQNYQIKTSK
jgi:hypothetical protein